VAHNITTYYINAMIKYHGQMHLKNTDKIPGTNN